MPSNLDRYVASLRRNPQQGVMKDGIRVSLSPNTVLDTGKWAVNAHRPRDEAPKPGQPGPKPIFYFEWFPSFESALTHAKKLLSVPTLRMRDLQKVRDVWNDNLVPVVNNIIYDLMVNTVKATPQGNNMYQNKDHSLFVRVYPEVEDTTLHPTINVIIHDLNTGKKHKVWAGNLNNDKPKDLVERTSYIQNNVERWLKAVALGRMTKEVIDELKEENPGAFLNLRPKKRREEEGSSDE